MHCSIKQIWWGLFHFICGPRIDDTLKEFWFLKGRGQPELNRWPLDLQSNALPLSYTPSADERRLNFNTNLAQFNPNMLPVRLGNNEIRAWNFISTHAIMIEGILHKQWQFNLQCENETSHTKWRSTYTTTLLPLQSAIITYHPTDVENSVSIKFDAFWAVADFVLILYNRPFAIAGDDKKLFCLAKLRTSGGTRTRNPRLRRPVPYPLGHGGNCL